MRSSCVSFLSRALVCVVPLGHVCSPHAPRARPEILHSPCRPAISLVAAAPGSGRHGEPGLAEGTSGRSAALAEGEGSPAAGRRKMTAQPAVPLFIWLARLYGIPI